MSASIFNQIDEGERPTLTEVTSNKLFGIGGVELKLYGEVSLPIQVGRKTYMVDVVVGDFMDEMLLGMPFLRMNGANIDHKNFKLLLNGERVPCYDIFARPLSAAVRTVVQVTLEPGQEYIVPGIAHYRGFSNRQALVTGTTRFVSQSNVLVARVMVDTHLTRQIPTRMYNIGSECVTIEKGTLVAQLQPVHAVYDPVGSNKVEANSSEPYESNQIPEHLQNLFTESKNDLNENDQKQLAKLLIDYSDVFSTGPVDLGKTDVFKHDIQLTDNRPIKHAPRRMSLAKQQEADRQIDQCVDMGIARPSNSAWAAPIVMVKKKDGSLRMCIDYRELNDKTIKDAFPLPKISELFDSLNGSTWFSTLDLASGYYQVENTDKARELSAFTSRKGLFEWSVMPFGLCNAPATFSRLMDRVLTGLQWQICLVYLDDIIIFSHSPSEMLDRLKTVFERLRNAKLLLKPSKCHLFKKKVQYLGHIISKEGIATDPEKVERVKNWPVPRNIHEVRAFTGFANYYRRFVPDFASIAKPLYDLTDKNVPFNWTNVSQKAFDTLRIKLITAPILSFPQEDGLLILDTDASAVGVGCVLSQMQNGVESVLAYGSKCLSKEEKNYCTTRLELLAIVTFTNQFRHYLLGRKFLVRTDHNSLRWLVHMKGAEGQLARWFEKLAEFDFTIIHRAGKDHVNADALSRRPCPKTCPCKYNIPATLDQGTQIDKLDTEMVCKTSLKALHVDKSNQTIAHVVQNGVQTENCVSPDADTPQRVGSSIDDLIIIECSTPVVNSSTQTNVCTIPERVLTEHDVYANSEFNFCEKSMDLSKTHDEDKSVCDETLTNDYVSVSGTSENNVENMCDTDGDTIRVGDVVTGWTMEELYEAQKLDSDIGPILKMKEKGWDRPKYQQISHMSMASKSYWHQWKRLEIQQGVLVRKFWSSDATSVWYQVLLPSKFRTFALQKIHDSPTGGHFGVDKTYKRIQRRFCWYKMQEDIKLWCRSCMSCAKHSRPQKTPKAAMGSIRSGFPMERVCIDIMGPLQETERHHQYILVIQDTFTKWVEAYPMPDQTTKTISNVIVSEWVSRYGTPYELFSDRGANFTSAVFEEMCKILGIEKTKTSGYRPQANGMVEHFNATLQKVLSTTSEQCHFDWDVMIPLALMAYRSSPHSSTGQTPNFMMFGREIKEPIDIVTGPEPSDSDKPVSDYCIQLKQNLQEAHELARESLGHSFETSKKEYDKTAHQNQFKVGDCVLLHIKGTKKSRGKVSKFMENYDGPYYIVGHIDPHVYIIQESPRAKSKIVHHDRLRPFKPRDPIDITWVQRQAEKLEHQNPGPLPTDLLSFESDSETPNNSPPNSPHPAVRPRRNARSPDRLGDWVTNVVYV
jgi:transposase InsO family protein